MGLKTGLVFGVAFGLVISFIIWLLFTMMSNTDLGIGVLPIWVIIPFVLIPFIIFNIIVALFIGGILSFMWDNKWCRLQKLTGLKIFVLSLLITFLMAMIIMVILFVLGMVRVWDGVFPTFLGSLYFSLLLTDIFNKHKNFQDLQAF
jgi:hypothetical protein